MPKLYTTYQDEQLVLFLREDDEWAFKEIYNRYRVPLSAYAFNFAGGRDEALDIVQDLFASLWRLRAELSITYSLKAYLYQGVRYGCIRLAQKQLKHNYFIKALSESLQTSSQLSPAVDLEAEEMEQQLNSAILSMTPTMQQVYLFSREEQLSHREIAARMNMAENTAKKHVQNALKLIKTQLGAAGVLLIGFCQLFR